MTARARAERIVAGLCGLYLHALLWLVVAAVVPVVLLGWRPAVITSGSMAPTLDAGDLVITTPAPEGDLVEMKSLIMFQEEGREHPVVHRVIGIDGRGGYWTKGDANPQADATPVPFEAVKGVGKVVVPFVGRPFVWFQDGQVPLLAGWALLTAGAVAVRVRRRRHFAAVSVTNVRADDDLLAGPIARRRAKQALSAAGAGLVIATGLVLVPAQAVFSEVTSNTGNYFASAASFPITARGTVGSATQCADVDTTPITIGASGVLVGRTIIVQVAIKEESAVPAVSAVDSRGNTYTVHADSPSGGGPRTRTVVMSAYVSTALQSGDTITVTHTNTNTKGVHIYAAAFSGLSPSSPVDVTNVALGSGTAPSVAATTTVANTLVWGGVSNRDVVSFTEDTDFINLFDTTYNCSGQQLGNHAGYRVRTSTATETYNPTLGSGSREWAAAIVAFRAADVIAPSAPTLTGTPGDAEAYFTWTTVTDPSTPITYQLYKDATLVYDGTATSYLDSTPSNGSTYTYTVKAKDGDGNQSAASNGVSISPTAGGSVKFVRTLASSTCGAASSVLTVPAGGVPAGHTVLVRVALRTTSSAAIAATDSRGNTYTIDKDYNGPSMRNTVLGAYISTPLQAGDTITVTHPDSTTESAAASEWSGLPSSGRVETTNHAGATNANPTVSATATAARTMFYGFVTHVDALTVTEAGSWSTISDLPTTCGGSNSGNHAAYQRLWAAGSLTYNPTLSGSKAWSDVVVIYRGGDSTAPSAPTLSGTRGDTEVDLSWNSVTDPTPTVTYQLYRDGSLIYDGTNLSYSDTGRTNGTQYAYTVKATDGVANQSVASNTVNVTPLIGASIKFIRSLGSSVCGGATGVVNVPADGVPLGHTLIARVAVREDASPTAISAVDSKGNTWTNDLDTSPNKMRTAVLSAYIATPLVNGDTITVTHPDGKIETAHISEWRGIASSSRVNVTNVGGLNTSTPSVAVTTTQAHTLVYGAISNTDAVTYTEATGWTTESHADVPNSAPCSGAGQTHGAFIRPKATGTYTYNPTFSVAEEWAEAVVAYKWAGDDATAPSAPTLSGTPYDQRNELSWTAVTDPSYPVTYKLFRDGAEIYSGSNLSYSDTGRTNGVSYAYKVKAYDAWSNASVDSNTQNLTPVADSTPPSAPTLSGTAGNSQNDMSWTTVTDPSSPVTYQLYRDVTLVYDGPNTSYADTGTTNGVAYNYTVKATDWATVPNQSVASNTVVPAAGTVSAAVIGKSEGGTASYIRQGGTYYVYANVSAGSTSVAADVSNITAGQTAVALTAGSYTTDGVSYGFRSAQLTAGNPLTEGSKTFTVSPSGTTSPYNGSVTVDNTAPTATDVQLTNGAATVGRPEVSDVITLTFSEPVSPASILAGWTGSSTGMRIHILDSGSNDPVTFFDTADTTQLPLGTVSTNGDMTGGGGDTFSMTANMVMSGNTITITLTTMTASARTTANSTSAWAPNAAVTDRAGNAMSTTSANETGAADGSF